MPVSLRLLTIPLILVLALDATRAFGQTAAMVDEILTALRGGGHVIVVRHGVTHPDQADTRPLQLDDVDRQRHLTDQGRAQAQALGAALRAAGVSIDRVYSSKFQRAVETARLIAGKEPQTSLDITEGGLVVSPNENARRAQALRALAGTPPAPATNTLIVSHKPNILDAFGKEWFEIKEGEASIFRPGGAGTYALVGRVRIDDWASARR
ncbi:MAG: histidine phosphatase family protein [Candidatus Rokuibacteriota bacterium]